MASPRWSRLVYCRGITASCYARRISSYCTAARKPSQEEERIATLHAALGRHGYAYPAFVGHEGSKGKSPSLNVVCADVRLTISHWPNVSSAHVNGCNQDCSTLVRMVRGSRVQFWIVGDITLYGILTAMKLRAHHLHRVAFCRYLVRGLGIKNCKACLSTISPFDTVRAPRQVL